MKKATLSYVIRDPENGVKVLPLESGSLYYVDRYTSQYSSDSELISNYQKKNIIQEFIRASGNIGGSIRITYATNIYDKKELVPLYNSQEAIMMNDDFENGLLTEVEKARKLLFNSPGQLFARMLLSSKSFFESYNYRLSLSFHEYLNAKKKGIPVLQDGDSYYVNFSDLFQYRLNNRKLGSLREVYEDMLDIWKDKIMELNDEDFYYYSRQLRILINKYEMVRRKHVSVSNLKVFENKKSFSKISLNQHYNNFRLLNKKSSKKKKIKDVA